MLTTAFFVGLCLIGSFVFAGSETAITGMGEHRIRKLLDEDRGPTGLLKLWLDDPSKVLTTLLAGNTLVNILASTLSAALALQMVAAGFLPEGAEQLVLAGEVFVLTLIVLVFGEIAPKTLAKAQPTWFLPLLRVVWGFHVVSSWLTGGLTWVAKALVRQLGVSPEPNGFSITPEQIEDMVRIGSEEGSIDELRGDMLQGVFELTETSVRSIMTPRTDIHSLSIDASLAEVLDEIDDSNFSRYPVHDGSVDTVIGIFYVKDLLNLLREGHDEADFSLRPLLRDPFFVPESKSAPALMQDFQTRKTHMALVVDEHGGTAGLCTLEDVIEELVGEIWDEYDEPEVPVVCTGPNTWLVAGSAEARELDEDVGIALPESESYSTVGGFVVEHLRRLPKKGDHFEWRDLAFTVLEADSKRVLRVEIVRAAEGGEAQTSSGADADGLVAASA